jgi:hypothetical protein
MARLGRAQHFKPIIGRSFRSLTAYSLVCAAGVYALSGTTADLTIGRTLGLDAGSYTRDLLRLGHVLDRGN